MYVQLLRYLTVCDRMDCSLQAPLSKGFSRQEYWSRMPFPTLEDLPDPGIKPESLGSPALPGEFFTTVPPGKMPRRKETRFKNFA